MFDYLYGKFVYVSVKFVIVVSIWIEYLFMIVNWFIEGWRMF